MGITNHIVDAAKAKTRILKLRKRGIGRRYLSELIGIPESSISKIASGKKRRIREATLAKILSVALDKLPKGKALIDAKECWKMLEELLSEGFTKAELANRLGYKSPAIQIHREKITVDTFKRVKSFYNRIMIGG
jgi:DNA-binding Xre family transcriptional regulator